MINGILFKKKNNVLKNITADKALKLVKAQEHCWIDVKNFSETDVNKILKTIMKIIIMTTIAMVF